MSHIDPSPLAAYNSLADSHLAGYFANTRMRRHLRKAGLITKRGVIVSENTYRLNMCRKEHKEKVKDIISQSMVHKVLDKERKRQAEIKEKLEEIAKIELVRRVRSGRQNKKDHSFLPTLSSRSSSQGSSQHSSPKRRQKYRPVSAPSRKSRRPDSVLSSNYEDDEEVIYLDDEGRPIIPEHVDIKETKYSSKDPIDTRHLYSLDSHALRKYAMLMAKMEQGKLGMPSPYIVPQVPIPPTTPRSARSPRSAQRNRTSSEVSKSESPKRYGVAQAYLHPPTSAKQHRTQQETLCEVKMAFHGSPLCLAREQTDRSQEIIVEQQHCGGNTLIVFKDRLEPGSTFSFLSHRHRGYPFSLTLYIDGRVDSRVSKCCEHRHFKGGRIGGKSGHFSILSISSAVPCYKCQVEKGIQTRSKRSKSKGKAKEEPASQQEVVVMETKREETPPPEEDYEQGEEEGDNKKEEVVVEVEKEEEEVEDLTEKPTDKESDYEEDFNSSSSDTKSEKSVKEESIGAPRDSQLAPEVVHKEVKVKGNSSSDWERSSDGSQPQKEKRKKLKKKKLRSGSSASFSSKSTLSRSSSSDSDSSKRKSVKTVAPLPVMENSDHEVKVDRNIIVPVEVEGKVNAGMEGKPNDDQTKSDTQLKSESDVPVRMSPLPSTGHGNIPPHTPISVETTEVKEEEELHESPQLRRQQELFEPPTSRLSISSGSSSSCRPSDSEQEDRKTTLPLYQATVGEAVHEEVENNAVENILDQPMNDERIEPQNNTDEFGEENRQEFIHDSKDVEFESLGAEMVANGVKMELEGAKLGSEIEPKSEESGAEMEPNGADIESKDVSDDKPNLIPVLVVDTVSTEGNQSTRSNRSSSSSSSSSSSTSGAASISDKGPNMVNDPTQVNEEGEDKKNKELNNNEALATTTIIESTPYTDDDINEVLANENDINTSSTSINTSSHDINTSSNDVIAKEDDLTAEQTQNGSELNDNELSENTTDENGQSALESENRNETNDGLLGRNENDELDRADGTITRLSIGHSGKTDQMYSDSESERENKEKAVKIVADVHYTNDGEDQREKRSEAESDPEHQHGGIDPDNVTTQAPIIQAVPAPVASEPKQGSIVELLERSKSNLEIKNLTLTKSQVFEAADSIERQSELTTINLVNSGLDDDDIQKVCDSIEKSPSTPVLLNLSLNPLTSNCVRYILHLLENKPSIEAVLLQGTRLGDDGVGELCEGILRTYEYRKSEQKDQENGIHELDLSDCKFGDEGAMNIARLLRSDLDLDTLTLSGNHAVGIEGWSAIASALARNKRIETLTLDANFLGDNGIHKLCEGLHTNKSLTALDINDVGITESGGKEIVDLLKRNTTILDLTLTGNPNVPESLMENIKTYISLNKASFNQTETQSRSSFNSLR